jgi:ClpP class serine protease
MRQIEMIKQGFYEAVMLGRGERLQIGPETLLRGQIWVGAEALHIGIIDELGTETDAASKAADIANVAHFDVVDLSTLVDMPLASTAFFIQSPQGITLPYPNEAGIYMLYIPPLPVQE